MPFSFSLSPRLRNCYSFSILLLSEQIFPFKDRPSSGSASVSREANNVPFLQKKMRKTHGDVHVPIYRKSGQDFNAQIAQSINFRQLLISGIKKIHSKLVFAS